MSFERGRQELGHSNSIRADATKVASLQRLWLDDGTSHFSFPGNAYLSPYQVRHHGKPHRLAKFERVRSFNPASRRKRSTLLRFYHTFSRVYVRRSATFLFPSSLYQYLARFSSLPVTSVADSLTESANHGCVKFVAQRIRVPRFQ